MRKSTADKVRHRARYLCEYCLSQENYSPSPFSVEHIFPVIRGGTDELDNLALCCQECNNHKYTHTEAIDPIANEVVAIYNPRQHVWSTHFRWGADDLELIGITATGRATIEKLQLNRPRVIRLRIALKKMGVHPISEQE